MGHYHMEFLRDGSINSRHTQSHIGLGFQPVWPVPGHRNHIHKGSLSRIRRPNEILRLSARAKNDQQVVWLTKRQYLACENILITIIIRYSSKDCSICCECEHCKWRTLALKAANQFCRKVLSFSRATSIPGHKHFVTTSQRLDEQGCGLCKY